MEPSSPMPVRPEIPSKGQWKSYLDRYPELEAEAEEVEMTPDLRIKLARVNAEVNRERWVPEESDDWDDSLPGDCENFALQKRKRLAEEGVPLGALRVCVGQIKRRGRSQVHAVLHVVTDQGDYVLDNLTDAVLPWTESRVRPLWRTAGGSNYQVFPPT